LDVATEGGHVELQNFADLSGPGQPKSSRHDQDVQLASLQAQRAQGVVVEVGDDPVQQPQAHGDARSGDRVDAAARLVHDRAAPSPSRLLYMQLSAGVKGILYRLRPANLATASSVVQRAWARNRKLTSAACTPSPSSFDVPPMASRTIATSKPSSSRSR